MSWFSSNTRLASQLARNRPRLRSDTNTRKLFIIILLLLELRPPGCPVCGSGGYGSGCVWGAVPLRPLGCLLVCLGRQRQPVRRLALPVVAGSAAAAVLVAVPGAVA